jgi:sensor domain CHASE-containing protein
MKRNHHQTMVTRGVGVARLSRGILTGVPVYVGETSHHYLTGSGP